MNHLAGIAVDVVRQLSSARRDVDAWKELAEQALALLAENNLELKRVRERYHALLNERRRERQEPKAAA